MKAWNRIISLLLCVCLFLEMAPAVYAESDKVGQQEEIDAGQETILEKQEDMPQAFVENPAEESQTVASEPESIAEDGYPWEGLTDEEFVQWVLAEENKTYLCALLTGSDEEEQSLFETRVSEIQEETALTTVRLYLGSLTDALDQSNAENQDSEEETGLTLEERGAILSRAMDSWVFPVAEEYINKIVDIAGCRGDRSNVLYGDALFGCLDVKHNDSVLGSDGIDLRLPGESMVYAPVDGTVYRSASPDNQLGNVLVLEQRVNEAYSYYLVFSHLSANLPVPSGSSVSAGDVIAYSGSYMLHFSALMADAGVGNWFAQHCSETMNEVSAQYGWLTEPFGTGIICVNPSADTVTSYTNVYRESHGGPIVYTFVTETEDGGNPVSGKCGPSAVWSLSKEGVLTITGTGALTGFTVEDDITVNASIGSLYGDVIVEVVIEDGITSIQNSAFNNCKNVRKVVLPESIKTIGEFVFTNCADLAEITIPSQVTKIGRSTFAGCRGLTEITFPDGVTYINNHMFENCVNLRTVNFPQKVTAIMDGTFSGCTSLETFTLPQGLSEIRPYLFSGCSNLKTVDMPSSATQIGINAFDGCSSLTSIIIPNGVTNIGNESFRNCNKLKEIDIPVGVTTIGRMAFNGCSGLKKVILPEGLTSIGGYAFHSCTNLSDIEIPSSVNSIGGHAFGACVNLVKIKLPDAVTVLEEYLFNGCRSLEEIILPSNLKRIGDHAIAICSSLSKIDIPKSVTRIQYYAFYGCSSLKKVVIPEGVTVIEHDSFYGCGSLENITIPSTVTKIEYSAFGGCGLSEVRLGPNVALIDRGAFRISNLSKIIIENPECVICDPFAWNSHPVFYGYAGSTAQAYAKEKGYAFQILGPASDGIANLETIHYLAFSNLAYDDWQVGDTVYSKLQDSWYDYLYGSDPKTGITKQMLYESIKDWEVISTSRDRFGYFSKGFYAVVFKGETDQGPRIVIAYRGSEPLSKFTEDTADAWADWWLNDVGYEVAHVYTQQLLDAQNYYRYCKESMDAPIEVTGHSLGGALASMASMVYGVRAITFNSALAFEALYTGDPEAAAPNFHGVDQWNIETHHVTGDPISGWCGEYKYFKYNKYPICHSPVNTGTIIGVSAEVVIDLLLPGASIFSAATGGFANGVAGGILSLLQNHSLQCFLDSDSATGIVSMKAPEKSSYNPPEFKLLDTGVYLGTSADNSPFLPAFLPANRNKKLKIYGGDGDDVLTVMGLSGDILVGGNCISCNVLDGGLGEDQYLYYKGNGALYIHDSGGYDTLCLNGFSSTDTFKLSIQKDAIIILINDVPMIRVSMNRSKLGVFTVKVNGNPMFRLDGFAWEKIKTSASVACPTDIEILDAEGNVVLVLENGKEQTVRTEFGNFYVFKDENGEFVKYFDMIDGYTFRIQGVDDGTMDITYCVDEGETYCLENVPVRSGMEASIEDAQIPVLAIEPAAEEDAPFQIELTNENTISDCEEHDWEEQGTLSPTHTADGVAVFSCKVCGTVKTETIAEKLGHNFDQEVADEKYICEPATCTEPGTYYVSCACGAAGEETFVSGEPAGHSYGSDHICTVCGEKDPEAVEEYVIMRRAALELNGLIKLMFEIEVPESLKADPDAYVAFGYEGASGKPVNVKLADAVPSGSNPCQYVFKFDIVAKELNEEVAVRVYDGQDHQMNLKTISGKVLEDNVLRYSVSKYIDAVLAAGNMPANLTNLMTQLRSFGAYAQELFGYKLDTVQGKQDLGSITLDTVAPFAPKTVGAVDGVTARSVSLILESGTELDVLFTVDNIDAHTFRVNGQPVTLAAGKGYYILSIDNIPAKELDTEYTISVDGTDILKVSALSYSYATLKGAAANAAIAPATVNIAKAVYAYNNAANNYFGK